MFSQGADSCGLYVDPFLTLKNMKSLFDSLLSLDDVRALISDGTRESEVLEYKTASHPFSEAGKKEIAKDVSAMANSLGGVIIYGIATNHRDKTLPEEIVPIDLKNVETFDRVLNAQVRPPIHRIRKKLIPPDNPQVMVVEVLASDDPPHQNLYDKVYYRRSLFECKAMEHDLVAMKFGRMLSPILDVHIESLVVLSMFSGEPPWSDLGRIPITISNTGRRVGRYINLLLLFPPRDVFRITTHNIKLHDIDNLYPTMQARQFVDNVGAYHPGLRTRIVDLDVSFTEAFAQESVDQPLIVWKLYVDEMSPRQGEVSLRDLGWYVREGNALDLRR